MNYFVSTTTLEMQVTKDSSQLMNLRTEYIIFFFKHRFINWEVLLVVK